MNFYTYANFQILFKGFWGFGDIELKRFEESHEKMIVRYEGFTGLEV